ncbi:unnamed protein product [Cyclocybe aegerita]|uniref:Uncharacterized protein n=1 Tax=Cyclocybe aegerita TaxID=1973307 RepID=A0A8S0WXG3_CYCAE|nr:unnamed protein product [Cyclocybe aegerita]
MFAAILLLSALSLLHHAFAAPLKHDPSSDASHKADEHRQLERLNSAIRAHMRHSHRASKGQESVAERALRPWEVLVPHPVGPRPNPRPGSPPSLVHTGRPKPLGPRPMPRSIGELGEELLD